MVTTSLRVLLRPVVGLLVVLALAAAGCSSDDPSEAEPTVTAASTSPVYLALGDSLAVGVGASDWPTGGYVPRLAALLNQGREAGDAFELVNVGRSGATTASVIEEGQLAEAVAVIEARQLTESTADDVATITVGVGGNDAFRLVAICNGVIDEACLTVAQQQIRDVRKNLLFIVQTLQEAAGPDVSIAVMTYYNPLVHERCPLNEFELIGDVLLEGEAELGLVNGLNDEIRAAAAAAGIPVAEVGELATSELTGDCLHASDTGHARIAAAFLAALS